ncbi:MAG: aspartate--tRNA ligase [Patescibacteria group bacterium]
MLINDFSGINKSIIGQELTVGGFVHTIRDHGGLIFIDLRNQTQILQCVVNPEKNPEAFKTAEQVHNEYVLRITGKVIARSEETVNPNLPTGDIELEIQNLEIVAKAKPTPFDIHADDKNLAGEEIRLKYRYLDLRRFKLNEMFRTKHKLNLAVRNWFDAQEFVEVQTPILANSSPEGARDYLVPSRLHPGKFYALPQAPQQFKQLLMVGGFSKYFQIAPCFRDEDPRADRHPGDFYQLDAEIAWADQESIFELNEKFAREVLTQFSDKKLAEEKFIRLTYDEAMNMYGSDKPDLRYDLPWQDAKPVFKHSGFKVFADLCEQKEAKVQALVVKGAVDKFSRSDLDRVQDIGRQNGLPGIAYIQYYEDGAKSPIFKFFGDEAAQAAKIQEINQYFGVGNGDLVLFVANTDKNVVFKAQNQMRQHIARHLNLIDESLLRFAWIYDFPFFEADEKTGKVDFGHNPFGVWQSWPGLTALETLSRAEIEDKLLELRATQYDLTLNGYEVLSGGVRNANPEALLAAFKVVGYTEEEVRYKFKHMLEAYEFGAPPHAGFAWGLERLFMILMEEENIREIIAFPKNGNGIDAMTGAPTTVSDRQLKELSIKSLS